MLQFVNPFVFPAQLNLIKLEDVRYRNYMELC